MKIHIRRSLLGVCLLGGAFCFTAGANAMTESQRSHAVEMFSFVDLDQSRGLSKEELVNVLKLSGQSFTDDEIDLVFGGMDADRSGELELNEFLALYAQGAGDTGTDVETVFNAIDFNRDGVLSAAEFSKGMRQINSGIEQRNIDVAFLSADTNGDGFLDYAEYMAAMGS